MAKTDGNKKIVHVKPHVRKTGIGPALAQSIVDYRSASGAFQRAEDLKRVQGIGEQTYEALKDLISVG